MTVGQTSVSNSYSGVPREGPAGDGLSSRPRTVERVFTGLVLFMAFGAIVSIFRLPDPQGDPWAAATNDGLQQAVWLAVYCVMLVLLLPRWRELIAAFAANVWVPCLMALVLASTLWSTTPGLTFRRSIAIDLAAMFGYYLAIRYTRDELFDILAWTLGAAMILSLVFVVALPTYGIYRDQFLGPTWRGVFLHKQPLGRTAALACVVLALQAKNGRARWVSGACAVVAAVLVWRSESSTALFAMVALAATIALLPLLKRGRGMGLMAAVMTLCAAFLTAVSMHVSLAEMVLASLNKDSTMTGRTGLWHYLLAGVGDHPLLGYGVSNFWRGWQGPGSAEVWRHIFWHPVQAHNGFLAIALDVGLVGVTFFLLSAALMVLQALRLYRAGHASEAWWPLLYAVFLLVNAVTESILVQPNSAFWMLYAFTVATTGVAARRPAAQESTIGRRAPASTAP